MTILVDGKSIGLHAKKKQNSERRNKKMASLNRVILVGNVGKDPELKTLNTGTTVCDLSVATSEKWNDKGGQMQEKTEWHRVVVWGKLAENCAKYIRKGRTVCVEGKLQTREWTDKDGGKRYTTEIVASNVIFLGSATGERSDSSSSQPALAQKGNGFDLASEVDNKAGQPFAQTAQRNAFQPPSGLNFGGNSQAPSFGSGLDEDVPF